ncbi:MAG: hypothetical protein WA020_16260 [Candidatus Acidiferrales bacterium]
MVERIAVQIAIYIVMAVFLDIQLLRYKPQNTWPGLIIVLFGVPVCFSWRIFSANRTERTNA